MKKNNNTTSLEDFVTEEFGAKGTASRKKYEKGLKVFKLGLMIEQQRNNLKLTQDQLAAKCGTKKSYISRIENEGSDIRLSTLMKIVEEGLGGRIEIVFPRKNTPK